MMQNGTMAEIKSQNKSTSGYKKTKLGWIPEEWNVIRLGEMVEKVGSGITPKGGSKVYRNTGIPLIRSQNVLDGKLNLNDVVYISKEQHKKMAATLLNPNDVLLNITGASIGRSCVVPSNLNEGNVNQHVCIIRTTDALNSKYLQVLMQSSLGQRQIDSFQAGGNREGLNFQQIRSFIFPLPQLPEQQKIAAILSAWDRAISLTHDLVEKKQELKRGLAQQLLTGKKRLKGFEGEWEEVPFGQIFRFLRTHSYSRENLMENTEDSSILYFHYGDLHASYSDRILDCSKVCIPRLSPSVKLPKEIDYLEDGDLIIADASEDYEGVGECIELKNLNGQEAISGLHTFACRDDRRKTCAGYRGYILSNHIVAINLRKLATGSSVYGVSKGNLSKLLIPLPSLSEQDAIASTMKVAEEEVKLLNQKLHALEQQKKGLMQVLLTGEVRVEIEAK